MQLESGRGLRVFGWPVIVSAAISSIGYAAGGPADFTLSSGAKQFSAADARGKYVAIHFLLKTDCPYCLRYVQEYAVQGDRVPGVEHVFVKPDSEAEIAAWKAKLPATVAAATTIYRDPDAKLAERLGVPGGYKFHGEVVHYPALILLGPDGDEVFRYVGKSNADRLPFSQFAAKLAELRRNPALKEYNIGDDHVAIGGTDPVAYFTAGKAEAGRSDLTAEFGGVVYRFATPENRHAFAAAPEKYAPAYGGWCATAMADGKKVEIDPGNFKVTNGRLFLFYKGWLGNAQKDWNKDEPAMTTRADGAWKKIAPQDLATRGNP